MALFAKMIGLGASKNFTLDRAKACSVTGKPILRPGLNFSCFFAKRLFNSPKHIRICSKTSFFSRFSLSAGSFRAFCKSKENAPLVNDKFTLWSIAKILFVFVFGATLIMFVLSYRLIFSPNVRTMADTAVQLINESSEFQDAKLGYPKSVQMYLFPTKFHGRKALRVFTFLRSEYTGGVYLMEMVIKRTKDEVADIYYVGVRDMKKWGTIIDIVGTKTGDNLEM